MTGQYYINLTTKLSEVIKQEWRGMLMACILMLCENALVKRSLIPQATMCIYDFEQINHITCSLDPSLKDNYQF